jgi:hypothetical protein
MTPITLQEYGINTAILAGKKLAQEVSPSDYYFIDFASHNSFRVILNDRATLTGKMATGRRVGPGEKITKVTIENTHPTDALTIRFTTGNGEPIDNFLNVLPTLVTPTVRRELPSSFAAINVVCTGVATPVELVALDCDRARIRFWTAGNADAWWGPDVTPTWTNEAGNQIGLNMNGATELETCAAIFVTGAVGVVVHAYVFSY